MGGEPVGGIGPFREDYAIAASNRFRLFDDLQVDDSQEDVTRLEIKTQSNLDTDTTYEFFIPPSAYDYCDLSRLKIKGKLKVRKINDTDKVEADLAEGDNGKVGIVNCAADSLFKLVSLKVQNTEVTDLSSYKYHYKAYVEKLLSYSPDVKASWLKETALWTEDTPGQEDKTAAANEGWTTRATWVNQSREVEFCFRPHIDILRCGKLLPNGIGMKLTLYRNDDDVTLMSPAAGITGHTLRVKVTELTVEAVYVRLKEVICEHHAKMMTKEPATVRFPFARLTHHDIPANSAGVVTRTLHIGSLPQLVLLFFAQPTLECSGAANPFNFTSQGLTRLYFRLNGKLLDPSVDADNYTDKTLDRYIDLAETLNLSDHFHTVGYRLAHFTHGAFFVALDLTRCCANYVAHPKQVGNLDVSVQFKTAPTGTLQMLAYSVFRAEIRVDAERNVTFDSP